MECRDCGNKVDTDAFYESMEEIGLPLCRECLREHYAIGAPTIDHEPYGFEL